MLLELNSTNISSVENAAQKVIEEFGSLGAVISNAGVLEMFTPVTESSPDAWWNMWEVNIKGNYLIAPFFLPLLLANRSGFKTFLALTSIGAFSIFPGASTYQIGKLAILGFCEYLMAEKGDQGLVADGIHPGAVMTDMWASLLRAMHGFLNDTPELAAGTTAWLKERREWLAGRCVSVT